MFTGLIQDIGTVTSVQHNGPAKRIVIETNIDVKRMSLGASVACSGCCLTVVEKNKNSFAADVSAETLSKTVIGSWVAGTRVNIEPSLQLGDELGGHFVFGHVDGLATIESITPEGDNRRIKIRAPQELAAYIASKGSVSLDGVSLTVNEVEGAVFGVNIIPHTLEHTTLGDRKPGNKLNIEIDMLARYVARMIGKEAA
jgi:riboflavin synthase